jgi:hypothetical protein
MASTECPACGQSVEDKDFACSRCELLLNPAAGDSGAGGARRSLVRAMLSPSDLTGSRPMPRPPVQSIHDAETVVTRQVLFDGDEVPRLIAGLDLALHPLHPFEAYLISFCDGRTTARELAQATQLRMVEVNAILGSLQERRLIELGQAYKPVRTLPPEPRSASSVPPVPTSPPPPAPVPPQEMKRPSSTPPPPLRPAAVLPRPRPTNAPPVPPRPTRAPPVLPRPPGAKTPAPVVAQDPTRSVLERVVALEQRGEVQRAIQLLEASIARVEKPAPLYNRLALILVDQQRDYRRAEALLQKAVNLEPGNAVYQQNLFRVVSLAASAAM